MVRSILGRHPPLPDKIQRSISKQRRPKHLILNTAVKLQIFRMRSLRCGNMSDSANTHRRCKLPMSPITDSLPLSEILCWRQPTAKRTALCSVPGNKTQTATRCSGEITRRTMNMSRNCRITTTERKDK